MFTSLKRIIKNGWIAFSRNIGLSVATVFVMMMVIFLITFLFLFNSASRILISTIQEKVDISVYFKKGTTPEEILEVKSSLTELPEIKKVEYVSEEEALNKFIEKHKDDPTIMESLGELGENPFLPILNIKAWQASQYEKVVNFLENDSFKNLIEKVDYFQRKPVIEKIFSATATINKAVLILILVLVLVAVLVALNTIRIAIYNSREEISTMRLVGASDWFIRGPFIIQGVLAGLFATAISLLITFLVCWGLDAKINAICEISTLSLFFGNFYILLLIQIIGGVGLAVIFTSIAIRRYLRV